ncbi:hypothetical protein [Streptomyces sp. I05A-00742]|uniref:hypothetical protein n=1 Tax=Streptomyces sp. I05A-00742 TaxID=2732853 RepID=UPI001487E6EC|nr:hypothetical protein [Streptomyces sp. I05A-00742]
MEHTDRTTDARTPGEDGPDGTRGTRRWLKPLIVFLLIAIPAGYLYISAMQSRNGNGDKQEEATVTGLEEGWPSRLQRRIYEVTVPSGAEDVAHFETNSWKSSSLFLQFTTTQEKFGQWLGDHGMNSSDLEDGDVTIDEEEAGTVGWDFDGKHRWTGTVREEDKPKPNLEVTANLDDPRYPRVFVVSTTTP